MPFGRRRNEPLPDYDEFDVGKREYLPMIQKDNYVKTTRYTILSFIPMTLYENFERLANVYFLIILFLLRSALRPLLTAAFKLQGFQMNYLMRRNISDLLSAFVNNNKPLFVLLIAFFPTSRSTQTVMSQS